MLTSMWVYGELTCYRFPYYWIASLGCDSVGCRNQQCKPSFPSSADAESARKRTPTKTRWSHSVDGLILSMVLKTTRINPPVSTPVVEGAPLPWSVERRL